MIIYNATTDWSGFQGRFIQNHYREAVLAVQSLKTELELLQTELQVVDEDFNQYLVAE